MKKILYGIIVWDILIGIFLFFALLADHLLLACLSLVSSAIGLVPLILLVQCLERIEDLEINLDALQQKLRAHEKTENGADPEQKNRVFHDSEQPKIEASKRWICQKCQSINKPGSSVCESCGAHYTCYQESPTEAPLTKWKLKENKKKHIDSQESN